jgi:hypothetical protein
VSLIPVQYKVVAILIAVAVASAAFWAYSAHQRTLGKAEEVTAETQRALTASIDNQAVTAQRVTDIQEKAHVADLAASAARADAVAARSADQRLRDRLAALSRAASARPAASGASAPASGSDTVPTDVFSRVDDAAGQLSEYADQLRVHLDACIGSYGTLIAPTKAP